MTHIPPSPGRRNDGRPLGALAGIAALVLLSGCVSTASPSATSEAPAWEAELGATSDPLAGPVELTTAGASRCTGGVLLEDEQRLVAGGRGAKEFVLAAPCGLRGKLTLRAVVGSLAVRLEGPGGPAFERGFKGIMGPALTVSVGSSGGNEERGTLPAGTYRYTFEADSVADFRFQVEAEP